MFVESEGAEVVGVEQASSTDQVESSPAAVEGNSLRLLVSKNQQKLKITTLHVLCIEVKIYRKIVSF